MNVRGNPNTDVSDQLAMTRKQHTQCFSSCWTRQYVKEMFVSQYEWLIAFTLLYLLSYLNIECYGFHIFDYKSTGRMKRESCEFSCINGECILPYEECDGKFDCSDKSDELIENCGGEPNISYVRPTALSDGSCLLPALPANGTYTVDASTTILFYSCSPGYQIYPFEEYNIAVCHMGTWYPRLPECRRTCGPRFSDSVETYCERNDCKVDCSKPMVEGTTVRMKCKHLYSQVDSSANPVSVCRDGSWDYAFIECVPECGNLVLEGGTLIPEGQNVKKVTIPWHVGIYKLNATKQYEQKCGGSIISRKLILSGKHYRDYYDERDTLSQTSTVKKIIIPPQYKGFLSSFAADIAFVILDKAFEITHVVQPVCIDWNNQYEAAQLTENNRGTVVGWGDTHEGKDPSAELKQLSVPFVSLDNCFNEVPEPFFRFLTRDKFCAGFTNGSSVCHGDSGGGLVFLLPDNKKYYLRGLVSASPLKEEACESRQYGVYTKVSDYLETLRGVEVNARV